MRPSCIVAVDPVCQSLSPFLVALESLFLVQLLVRGSMKAFDLAVGLRAIGPGELVPDA